MTFGRFAYNNIIRNFRAYLAYFLSSIFSIMIFFVFAVSMFHPIITDSGIQSGSTAFMALMISELIILGFSLLFILYSLGNFLKSRLRDFGVMIIIGMSNKQLKRLILIENLIIGLLAIMLGILLGLSISKLFLLYLGKIFYMNLTESYFPIKAILMTIISFMLLFLITGPLSLKLLNKNNIFELLVGTKKPKKDIKPSKLFGILGISCLMTGYAMILFGNKLNINGDMYMIALLITLGMFLFFSQFTILILKHMKNREKFYKNKINMLLIGNLVYKMKDNSRLLFLMTILLSGTLVAFTTTLTLVTSQGKSSKNNFPMVYSYFSEDNNNKKYEDLEEIRNTIKEYDYKELSFPMLEYNNEVLLSMSNYNKLSKQLGLDKINLKIDEGIIVPRYNSKEHINSLKEIKAYKIKNVNIKIKESTDRIIFPTGMFSKIIVIHDNLYNNIQSKFSKINFHGFDYENWQNSADITEALKEKHFNLDRNDMKSYFLTLPDMYLAELQQSKILQFMGIFIGVILFMAVLSFLYFRLYTDEPFDKVKYNNLSKIGLSFKNMNKIVSIEIGILFFVPFIIAIVNSIFSLLFLNSVLNNSFNLKNWGILLVLSCIYSLYFHLLKKFYIRKVWFFD
ncbi:ABC transporter permease [Clostridioides sp. ES-S-0005-03]|uniref:ABC transporter permease n=1 Tax=unclassified Clostridioides TaxID=2635829 RepID=UPI001D0C7C63|nr:ABC transporter permease [Clostridioides sp. ES-S-0001-03]MCC0673299.1 ABC transporter permease [Clostridioides sp. ES-S-0145-01]MCC0679125.1 ABC transporter permease [Clostridioides sp. ES-S-0005-03]UDN48930.1 ABC transporter permease [Clostridioides sp. ES-S-0173-01]